MKLTDYCSNMSTELTAWKAKIYDVVRKMDKLSTGERGETVPMIRELHNIVDEASDRINKLEKECPTEWDPQRAEIDHTMSKLRDNWEKAWGQMGTGNIGG